MVPIHALITGLIRLLGLYFGLRALDSAAQPFLMMFVQSSFMAGHAGEFPNPWLMFLPFVAFYLSLAAAVFFAAPRLAALMLGGKVPEAAEVGVGETLLFCTGLLIIAFAFTRITDTASHLMGESLRTHEPVSFDNATLVHVFLTAVLFCGGVIVVGKFHRISDWMANKRRIANHEQDGATARERTRDL